MDGKELWLFPSIDFGGARFRGSDVMEVPDRSLLLINHAKLSAGDQPHLLGVDLWTGKIEWQQPDVDSLWEVVPLRDPDRVLLVTLKLNKKETAVILGLELTPYANLVGDAIASSTTPYRFEMVLLDSRTGHEDWTYEYPRSVVPTNVEIREMDDQLYFADYQVNGSCFLSRIDLGTGKRVWELKKSDAFGGPLSPAPEISSYTVPRLESIGGKLPIPLELSGDRVVFSADDLYAVDSASGKVVWAAKHLAKIHSVIADQDEVVGTTDDGAFAFSADQGASRWTFGTPGNATNALLDREDNAILFSDDTYITKLDAVTGKEIRSSKHNLGEKPVFVQRVAPNLVIAASKKNAVLVNIATVDVSPVFPRPELVFASADFWVSWQTLWGFSDPPPDLARELHDRWTAISANPGPDPEINVWYERVESFLNADFGPVYANDSKDGSWRFRRVNRRTGAMQTFDLTGRMPDANASLGLVYLVEGDNRLRAVPMPAP